MFVDRIKNRLGNVGPKISVAVSLSLIFVGVGILFARWGYVAGAKALAGVTLPDVAPRFKQRSNPTEASAAPEEGMALLEEKTVLIRVYDLTNPDAQSAKPATKQPAETLEDSTTKVNQAGAQSEEQESEQAEKEKEKQEKETTENKSESETTASQHSSTAANLPLTSEDKGVSLSVTDVQRQDGSLVLSVQLKNQSGRDVRFLYSFLDVQDDQERTLSAITDGLPQRLPAASNSFSGKVLIPGALLENSKSISLTLTDYPDQELKLNIGEIPAVK